MALHFRFLWGTFISWLSIGRRSTSRIENELTFLVSFSVTELRWDSCGTRQENHSAIALVVKVNADQFDARDSIKNPYRTRVD